MSYQPPPQQPPQPPQQPPQQPYQPQQQYPPQQQYGGGQQYGGAQQYGAPPPQKSSKVWLYVLLGVLGLCVLCGIVGAIAFAAGGNIISRNIEQITGQITAVAPTFSVVETAVAQFTPEPPPAQNGGNTQAPQASGVISEVTMARGVTGEMMEPEDPTNEFSSNDTFHAVTKIEDAPAGTKFQASWYAEDVGDAADPNTLIDSTEITSEGTRYLDFNLTPNNGWPTGTYRVEIFVNGTLDQVVNFSVQ